MAQRANACFSCGSSLQGGSRRQRSFPWSDFLLFFAIAVGAIIWWSRPPIELIRQSAGLLGTATPTQALVWRGSGPSPVPTQLTPGEPGPGPTPTPGPSATPTPVPTPIMYTVKSGDTLSDIAAAYGMSSRELVAANGLNADLLSVGQIIRIPVLEPEGLPTSTPVPTPVGATLIYKISQGDTLEGLAKRFGSQTDWIRNANKLPENVTLQIGQHILIPRSANTPQPTATATPAPTLPPPTAKPHLRAPVLLFPAHGSTVTGSDVLLTWTSAGHLAENEWYALTVFADGGSGERTFLSKSTGYRLGPDVKPAGRTAEIRWQIYVVNSTGGVMGESLTPASEVRRFSWR